MQLMNSIVKIDDIYAEMIKGKLRDVNTNASSLKESLIELGEIIGREIIGRHYVEHKSIVTPMDIQCVIPSISNKKTVIVSTRDDFKYFAQGIVNIIPHSDQGFMDFDGKRGISALTSEVRLIKLPDLNNVECVIVAKSVLATGCTALSLLERAINLYSPRLVIVATVFYSESGVLDLKERFPNVEIILIGEADTIDQDGMLIPGVGNIDKRIKE